LMQRLDIVLFLHLRADLRSGTLRRRLPLAKDEMTRSVVQNAPNRIVR